MPPELTYVRVSVVAWTKGAILGFANMDSAAGGSPQVYVFHGPVRKAAEHSPFERTLARVMVHEILHSLGLAHSPFGIMRDTVGEQDLASFLRGPALRSDRMKQLHLGLARLRPATTDVGG